VAREDSIDGSADLLLRAAQGDEEARSTLLARCHPRLLRRIRLMMGDQARRVAESVDFVQDVLIEAIEAVDPSKVRDEQHLLRWMTAVARNKVRDSARRRRERVFESLSISTIRGPERTGASPPSRAERQEYMELLADALEQLTPDHRRVIELRDLEGLRFHQIAEAMGRSEDAVQTLHMRAMMSLGRILDR
jgi:RNA polymerase sigma-70 factor (ECF subfamily)